MRSFTQTCVALPCLLAVTACGGIPKKTFVFDAIDVTENPRPVLIVVNDDWVDAWDKNQVVNVSGNDELSLTIPFPSSTVEITVAPLTVDGNVVANKPMSRKDARDLSGFNDEMRSLRLTDPVKHLFVLTYKQN